MAGKAGRREREKSSGSRQHTEEEEPRIRGCRDSSGVVGEAGLFPHVPRDPLCSPYRDGARGPDSAKCAWFTQCLWKHKIQYKCKCLWK